MCECAQNPIPPVVSREKASCQEVVHYAYEEGFDLRRLLPAPTNTPVDAGPYITTVSYTHLDVYKRQIISCLCVCSGRFTAVRPVRYAAEESVKEQAWQLLAM